MDSMEDLGGSQRLNKIQVYLGIYGLLIRYREILQMRGRML